GRYERYDGTSMAAPHVSGLAALLWAVHPNASLGQVRKAILDSGVRMSGVAHGRIDASRALTALDAATGGTGAALKLSRTSITFKAGGADTATLAVTAVVGDGVAVAVTGAGCELREGRLHVRAGAGCAVHAAEGEAAAIQWQLPDGAKVSGGHLYGQFVRRGE